MRFCDIPGHEEEKKLLVELADSGRIPHAILLEGPEGIGKHALARAFLQYVGCSEKMSGDSCGKCPSCRQHSAMQHIDTIYSFPYIRKKSGSTSLSNDYLTEFIEFVNESPYMDKSMWLAKLGSPNTKPIIYVDESNELIHRLSYAPHTSKYKSVIMWQVDKLNDSAANKLLKLIEEPPGQTIFIMTSDNPGVILPTIYSRVQRIKVKPLDNATISQWLVDNYEINLADAQAYAPMTRGSIVEAQRLMANRTDTDKFLDLFIRLMRLSYQRDIVALRAWSEELASERRDTIVDYLEYMARMLRENFVANFHVPEINVMMPDEAQFSNKFAPFVNERNAIPLFEAVSRAITDIRSNASTKIVLFDLAITVILELK